MSHLDACGERARMPPRAPDLREPLDERHRLQSYRLPVCRPLCAGMVNIVVIGDIPVIALDQHLGVRPGGTPAKLCLDPFSVEDETFSHHPIVIGAER